MKIAVLPFLIVLTIIFTLFTFVACPLLNYAELNQCKYLDHYEETIYEPHFFLDKCYVIEDGEELTISKYITKHKYDGVRIRK